MPAGNLIIELDSSEIFPNDPGMGTPAMVYKNKGKKNEDSGTFYCAIGEGELSNNGTKLMDNEFNWLCSQDDKVEEFINSNS
jgi:hypothetical protein